MTPATRWTLALAASTLLSGSVFVGCAGEDDDDTDSSPTPTPSPTPEPTPPPSLEGQYRTTEFAIAPSGVGFDLDSGEEGGDPEADNNLPIVFDTLYVQMEAAIYDALLAALGDETLAQTLTTTIMSALETKGLILDVEDLNSSIATAIDSGSLIYLEALSGTPREAVLTWYDGLTNLSGGYFTNYEVGNQTGTVDLTTGEGVVGPGTFRYELSSLFALNVSNTLATFDYAAAVEGGSAGSLTNGLLGGAILMSEIENLLRSAIPDQVEQADEDAIVSAVLELIEPFMDIRIGGQPAFSVAFTFTTESQVFAVAE